ncbi:MAG: peptidoglycan editing factor PgeF [Candidatus Cyclobacteriaceae bacterium M3_2C_046]
MIKKNQAGLPLFNFASFSRFSKVDHFVTSRSGGMSENSTLNLSLNTEEPLENALGNRKILAEALGINPSQLLFPKQCHTSQVKIIQSATPLPDLDQTDALVTNVPGLYLSVLVADCVPILLYDPVNEVIGAVHSGWRGTAGKILSSTIKAMQEVYDSLPENIIAGIGPSISAGVYEVGTEVIQAFQQAFPDNSFTRPVRNKPGHAFCNLWQANRWQLIQSGVPDSQIEIGGLCTYTSNELFFSARKGDWGRFAAGIMINS